MIDLIDSDFIQEIENRFGPAVAQSVMDSYLRQYTGRADVQCLEVLQMSEIACRFRGHVREMINEYRDLGAETQRLEAALLYARQQRRVLKSRIADTYKMYRTAYADFLRMYEYAMSEICGPKMRGRNFKNPAPSCRNAADLGIQRLGATRPSAFRRDYLREYGMVA